jgi:hypothetical protein
VAPRPPAWQESAAFSASAADADLDREIAAHLAPFGPSPLDPPTFVSVSATLGVAAAGAALLPIVRALWANPIEALRRD